MGNADWLDEEGWRNWVSEEDDVTNADLKVYGEQGYEFQEAYEMARNLESPNNTL